MSLVSSGMSSFLCSECLLLFSSSLIRSYFMFSTVSQHYICIVVKGSASHSILSSVKPDNVGEVIIALNMDIDVLCDHFGKIMPANTDNFPTTYILSHCRQLENSTQDFNNCRIACFLLLIF